MKNIVTAASATTSRTGCAPTSHTVNMASAAMPNASVNQRRRPTKSINNEQVKVPVKIAPLVFLLHALHPNIPMRTIYRGVIPFLIADFAVLLLLTAFPALALWLTGSPR